MKLQGLLRQQPFQEEMQNKKVYWITPGYENLLIHENSYRHTKKTTITEITEIYENA